MIIEEILEGVANQFSVLISTKVHVEKFDTLRIRITEECFIKTNMRKRGERRERRLEMLIKFNNEQICLYNTK